MLSNFGTGPVMDGVGLFHVISSYCGEFSISATACRAMMPDPEFYRQCLLDSFAALRQATLKKTPAARKIKPAARKKAPLAKKRAPRQSAAKA
jgi:hypothetical protein